MKKAFLVKATVMTRVIIDVDDDFNTRDCDTTINGTLTDTEWDNAVKLAIPCLQDNICEDNIDDIVEDIECPYGEFEDDIERDWSKENLSIAQIFNSNDCGIVSRGDYEGLPIPLYAMEFDDNQMQVLADNIYNVLHCQYGYNHDDLNKYFSCDYTNDDYEDLDIAYWKEMEECAIAMGMRYYEDMTDEEYNSIKNEK